DVRRMSKAADEQQALTRRPRFDSAERLVNGRKQHHLRIGLETFQKLFLDRADDQRQVGLADQRQLFLAFRVRDALRGTARVELRQALLAQEMQVDRVEDQ